MLYERAKSRLPERKRLPSFSDLACGSHCPFEKNATPLSMLELLTVAQIASLLLF